MRKHPAIEKKYYWPVFFWANSAEANFILHQRQYEFRKDDISVAKVIVENKLRNQKTALKDTVYEVNNTDRVLNNLMVLIDDFVKNFEGGDSIIIFDVSAVKLTKYGNAIHRDTDIVYF